MMPLLSKAPNRSSIIMLSHASSSGSNGVSALEQAWSISESVMDIGRADRDGVAFYRGNINAATDEEASGLSGRRLHLDREPRGRDLLEDLGPSRFLPLLRSAPRRRRGTLVSYEHAIL
jgi:hypothetical protein